MSQVSFSARYTAAMAECGGLRNLTGRVNRDGPATVWATTSTVGGSGDGG